MLTTNSGDISEYVGLWEYVDENLWFRIYDDETWEFLNDQEDVIASGALWVEETGITIHFADTGHMLCLDRTVSGDLIVSENDGMLVPVDSISPEASIMDIDLVDTDGYLFSTFVTESTDSGLTVRHIRRSSKPSVHEIQNRRK